MTNAQRDTAAWDLAAGWEPVASGEAADASAAYRSAMSRCPVAHVDGMFGSFWAVLSAEELVKAAHDTATFSNVLPMFGTRRPPLECDPPEHRLYRRFLNPYFSKARVGRMAPWLRALADEMLAPLLDRGEIDFVETFSYAYPTRVLCRLLGVPDSDWKIINEWGASVDRDAGTSKPGSDALISAGEKIVPYMLELIERRRREPLEDDLVSGIIKGDPDLSPLTDEAVLGMIMMLISAGHNTATSAIGNLVLTVARDAHLQSTLRNDTSLIPVAVEESVRIDAPQQAMRRVATRDAEIAGERVAAGDHVWLVFGAANVDETVVENPTEFRLDRGSNRHHGFGRGIHMCLGAPLARLQVAVVMEQLLSRTSTIELAGEIRRMKWPRMGVSRLPLKLVGVRGRLPAALEQLPTDQIQGDMF